MNKFINKYKGFPHQILYKTEKLFSIKEYRNSAVLDMFDTLVSIVYHDFFTDRTEGANPVRLTVPVQNYELFKEINKELNELVSFMTGTEEWFIDFEETDENKYILKEDQEQLDLLEFNSIALLSAGLDSMAGVSKEIREQNRTLFINSYTHNETKLIGDIYNGFKDFDGFKAISIKKYPRLGDREETKHSNQRTRTLAFLANALIFSDYFNVREVKMYENGIMSLNPSFDLRRGVTKTTHHKTIFMLNNIFERVGIKTKVVNPFRFKTKKEVILSINDDMKSKIKYTRTCSKGNVPMLNGNNRNQGSHCGCCIACLLRQIGLHDLDIDDVIYKIPKYEKVRDTASDRDVRYSYHEKKSLIEYYKRFKKEIDNGTIYDHLDGVHKKYFDGNSDFIDELDDMLNRFSVEVLDYVSRISYD